MEKKSRGELLSNYTIEKRLRTLSGFEALEVVSSNAWSKSARHLLCASRSGENHYYCQALAMQQRDRRIPLSALSRGAAGHSVNSFPKVNTNPLAQAASALPNPVLPGNNGIQIQGVPGNGINLGPIGPGSGPSVNPDDFGAGPRGNNGGFDEGGGGGGACIRQQIANLFPILLGGLIGAVLNGGNSGLSQDNGSVENYDDGTQDNFCVCNSRVMQCSQHGQIYIFPDVSCEQSQILQPTPTPEPSPRPSPTSTPRPSKTPQGNPWPEPSSKPRPTEVPIATETPYIEPTPKMTKGTTGLSVGAEKKERHSGEVNPAYKF